MSGPTMYHGKWCGSAGQFKFIPPGVAVLTNHTGHQAYVAATFCPLRDDKSATVIVRQVVKAVAPVPVLAAGGFADGAGLAVALALRAHGVLMGTRFLATQECPVPQFFKDAIVGSDGTDTVLSTVPDTLTGRDWPGAWSRVARTAFVEDWTGQEPELRRRRSEVRARLEHAWEVDQPDYWNFWWGRSAGLVESVLPADELVRQIMTEAENSVRTLSSRLITPG
jgi:nitronate monooxygenase